jgi:hypothetical protein
MYVVLSEQTKLETVKIAQFIISAHQISEAVADKYSKPSIIRINWGRGYRDYPISRINEKKGSPKRQEKTKKTKSNFII